MSSGVRWFLILTVVASMSRAFAHDDAHERARRLHQNGVIVPLEKIVAKVRAGYPDSKVLEADLKDKEHRLTYEIEIVDKAGVVHEMYFDARSGELLRTKQE